MDLRVRDWFQGLLQALRFDFPSKMCDLDAYLTSYGTFRCFRVLESCEALFDDLGLLFFDVETWEGFGVLEVQVFGA